MLSKTEPPPLLLPSTGGDESNTLNLVVNLEWTLEFALTNYSIMKSLTILSAAAAAQQHRETDNGGLWLIWSGDLNP